MSFSENRNTAHKVLGTIVSLTLDCSDRKLSLEKMSVRKENYFLRSVVNFFYHSMVVPSLRKRSPSHDLKIRVNFLLCEKHGSSTATPLEQEVEEVGSLLVVI